METDAYDITTTFDIELPNPVTPSNTVGVQFWTPHSPLTVPIEFEPPLRASYAAPATNVSPRLPSVKTSSGQDPTLLYKMPFHITESVPGTYGSSVSVTFDKNYLVMTGSRMPAVPQTSRGSSNSPNHRSSAATRRGRRDPLVPRSRQHRLQPRQGRVSLSPSLRGRRHIHHSRPGQQPVDLSRLRIVCGIDNNQTALITSTGWGEFGPVQMLPSPWLDDVHIKWPMSPDLDLVDAFKLMQRASYRGTLDACTLRQPLYPRITEPSYIFSTGGLYVAVGVFSKKVTQFSSSGRAIEG